VLSMRGIPVARVIEELQRRHREHSAK